MKVQDILIQNGFQQYINQISKPILNIDCGSLNEVKKIGTSKYDLFDGLKIFNSNDDNIEIIINLESDSEFVPFTIFEHNKCREYGYNNDGEKIYTYEDGVEI